MFIFATFIHIITYSNLISTIYHNLQIRILEIDDKIVLIKRDSKYAWC